MATNFMMSNDTQTIRRGFAGFSWTTLLFGPFVPLFRKDWYSAIVFLILNIIFCLVPNIILAFFYNRAYTGTLLARGFKPVDKTGELLVQEMKPKETRYAILGISVWARIVLIIVTLAGGFLWSALTSNQSTWEGTGQSVLNEDGTFNQDVVKERSLIATCSQQYDIETEFNTKLYGDTMSSLELGQYVGQRAAGRNAAVQECIANVQANMPS